LKLVVFILFKLLNGKTSIEELAVAEGFRERRKKENTDVTKLKDELYKQIGQMKVELDWLKKIWPVQLKKNDKMIDSW
jgi:hypothetical protein